MVFDAVIDCKCQVSFTEKVRQCQAVLCRDYPSACVFRNQMDVLDLKGLAAVSEAKNFDDVCQAAASANFVPFAHCVQHEKQCRLPSDVDLCFLSSPCTDDSLQGSKAADDGATRKGSRLHQFKGIGAGA